MASMLDRLRRQPPRSSGGGGDIVLSDVTKSFGATAAIKELNLSVYYGELLVLLGPSGSGKTTTLNLIAGLEELDRGSVTFGTTDMTRVPPEDRDISVVFQNYSLYPHLNVRENITFPLTIRRTPARVIAERLESVTALLGIEALLERKINQLSGGQRQRVAIAKALTKRPTVFLLDEPFSALDAVVRRQLRAELLRLHRELGTTMVFVTHDQEEAMTIADRIAVMRDGAIVQIGAPLEIYNDPTDLWVAQFIGSHPINVIPSFSTDQLVHLFRPDGPGLQVSSSVARRLDEADQEASLLLGIRPEFVEVTCASEGAASGVTGKVFTRQVFGNEILYDVKVEEGTVRSVVPTLPSTKVYSPGDSISLDFLWEGVFAFDSASKRRLPLSFSGDSE
jgi:multiple sugar transport system ATP-binding protein